MIVLLNPRLAETLDLEMIRRELPGVQIEVQEERRDLETRPPEKGIDETWRERAKSLGYNVL